MNQDFSAVILNINAHFAETGDGGKAVSSFQKMGDLCGSFGKGTEHDGTVGDGFVAGNGDFSPEGSRFCKFHNAALSNVHR